MPKPVEPRIDAFLGLRNTIRPERQPLGALAQASNVLLSDEGGLESVPGFASALTLSGITDIYAHRSGDWALVVAAGTLYSVTKELGVKGLTTLSDSTLAWAQSDNRIHYVGATDAGTVISGNRVVPLRFPQPSHPTITPVAGALEPGLYQFAQVYRHIATGMETTASPSFNVEVSTPSAFLLTPNAPVGYESDLYVTTQNRGTPRYLATATTPVLFGDTSQLQDVLDDAQVNCYPLPAGVTAIEVHDTSLHAAVYDATKNSSLVLLSRPFTHHWFRMDEDGFMVPGRVLQMMSTDKGLLIGTDSAIWLNDATLERLVDYGCVPGRPITKFRDGTCSIWTKRGLASFPPFTNVFEGKLSVAPGSSAAVAEAKLHGAKYAAIITDTGGTAFNDY